MKVSDVLFRCPACGSSSIGAVANVYWDESRGYWRLSTSKDSNPKCWCGECDVEFDLEQAIEAAEKTRKELE